MQPTAEEMNELDRRLLATAEMMRTLVAMALTLMDVIPQPQPGRKPVAKEHWLE